jgi:DNA repair protein RadC
MHKVNRYILTYRKGPKFETIDLYDPTCAREFCLSLLSCIPVEKFAIIAQDHDKKLIGYEYYTGTPSECDTIYTSSVFTFLLTIGADSFIIAHNHPNGDTIASKADVDIKDTLKILGQSLGVPLNDCFIVAGDRCKSIMGVKNGK